MTGKEGPKKPEDLFPVGEEEVAAVESRKKVKKNFDREEWERNNERKRNLKKSAELAKQIAEKKNK